MMTVGDLPSCGRFAQAVFEPGELLTGHLVRIKREVFDQPVSFDEVVISPAAHVEIRVVGLKFEPVDDVVIAEYGIKFDAGIEQVLVRLFEVRPDVLFTAGFINIVAEHEYEFERSLDAVFCKLAGDGHLSIVSGAGVANHGEGQRSFSPCRLVHREKYAGRQQQQNHRYDCDIAIFPERSCHYPCLLPDYIDAGAIGCESCINDVAPVHLIHY